MKGTVIIENNKFTDEFFNNKKSKESEDTKEIEKTIEKEKPDETSKTWKVKFYNKGMIMSSKLMEIPLKKDNL